MNTILQIKKLLNLRKNKFVPNASKSELLFFLIWPFGALVRALRYFRTSYAKTIFWLFCIYFGFVFIYGDPNYADTGADSARYAERLIYFHDNPVSFANLTKLFYSSEDGLIDIYQPLVTWIVASITDNPHWLFMIFAAVFGYFYVQNLWIIFDRLNKKTRINLLLFLLMLSFALINPVWNINGVRMWTAAQVFVFGVFRYYLLQDKKGLIWIFSSVMFHFSFLFPVSVFFLFFIIPKNIHVLLVLFYLSSLISEIDLPFLRNLFSFLPDVFQPKVNAYTNEEYIENIRLTSGRSMFYESAQFISKFFLYIFVFLIYRFRNKLKILYPQLYNLFLFALFMGIFAQLASNVASGGRFFTLVNVLIYGVFIALFANYSFRINIAKYQVLFVPLLFIVILFSIRVGFEVIGIQTFIGNPFSALIFEDSMPIIEMLIRWF